VAASRNVITAVASGFLAGAVCYFALALLGAYSNEIGPWVVVPRQVLNALILVGPGLIAGFVARRSGLIVGGAAGAIVSVVGTLVLMSGGQVGGSVLDGVAFGLSNLITNGASGIAGVALSQFRGSDAF
jgi:hypothetical protein